MLWNIFGWTALEMAKEHLHHENSYCTIGYCTCVVEDGVSVCTCHHHDLRAKNADHVNDGLNISDTENTISVCYFEKPHQKPKDTLTIASFTEIKAFFYHKVSEPGFIKLPPQTSYMYVFPGNSHVDDLFRPPQV